MTKQKPSKRALWDKLADARAMTSLMEKELIPATQPFERNKENWVKAWLDHGNTHMSDCGEFAAIRAVTDRGELFWFVKSKTRRFGYHSDEPAPEDAIEDARTATERRRAVRQNWDFVRRLRRDLLLRRSKMNVRIQDAYDSPLCTLGVKAFMRRIGMARCENVPGFVVAVMACFEEQVGFVLHQAWLRHRDTAPTGEERFPHAERHVDLSG